jgi:tetratricopeptide (TPR) repeat protein
MIEHLNEHPDDLDTLTDLGKTYLAYNRDLAVEIFEEVLAADANHEEALYQMAHHNYAIGEYDKTIEQVDVIIKNNPAHPDANLLKGYAYSNGKKDYASGIRAYEDFIAVAEPSPKVDIAEQNIERWTSEITNQ